MTRTTAIEWTEHTWNPFGGCSIKSAGCKNCYAMATARRLESFSQPTYKGTTHNGIWTGKINRATDATMRKPLKIKEASLIFVNSMSDFFHKNANDAWRAEALAIIKEAPQHRYQILTKRPELIAETLDRMNLKALPPSVWLGATVENAKVVDRIDFLRAAPASVRFLSVEPLIGSLGPINLDGIHQVITGGESGLGARKCEGDWVREVRDQAVAAGVPFFHKQWGKPFSNPLYDEAPPGENAAQYVKRLDPVGKGGSLVDGRAWKEFPPEGPQELGRCIASSHQSDLGLATS